jgi:hypothetical protein
VSKTNAADTLLTENVQTAAGQQTMSRQSSERGTLTEDVVLQDLFNRYPSNMDSTILNQATIGLTNIAQSVSCVDASPTSVRRCIEKRAKPRGTDD